MKRTPSIRLVALVAALVLTILLAATMPFVARAQGPLKIGFGMAMTGGLSANGKPALLALQIWQDDINKKGGLLGRQVQLVFYDDQTNPATVPGIYTKLLDVDKVDLVIGPYATNMAAPAMPVIITRANTAINGAVRSKRRLIGASLGVARDLRSSGRPGGGRSGWPVC